VAAVQAAQASNPSWQCVMLCGMNNNRKAIIWCVACKQKKWDYLLKLTRGPAKIEAVSPKLSVVQQCQPETRGV